jgi:hypothetical protein
MRLMRVAPMESAYGWYSTAQRRVAQCSPLSRQSWSLDGIHRCTGTFGTDARDGWNDIVVGANTEETSGDAFGGGEDQVGWKRRVGAVAGAGVLVVYRAGAERFWSLCAPSAAKPERTAAVAMTVITAITVIAGIPRFDRNEEGRTKERSCPKKPTPNGPHSGEGKSQGPEIFGMKWNETAFWRVCKLLKRWWPGTESNRRRQPFQGCAPR